MKPPLAIAILSALALSGCAHNQQAHTKVMDTLPPVIKTLPIQIVPSSEHDALAWSTAGMMEQYISYNPRIAAKLSPDVLAFALVHEYAHLHLQHIAPFESPKSPAEIRQQEFEADRFAAMFWATNNPKVVQAAAAAFRSPDAQKVLGLEKPSLKMGYPTREERAQAILELLASSTAQ